MRGGTTISLGVHMRLVPTAALTLGLLVPGLADHDRHDATAADAAAASCGGLRATIVGNARANTIDGTDRRDVIAAGDGNDTIRGLGGNDVICGGEGADRILGGADDDTIYGGTDRYWTDRFGLVHKEGDVIDPGAGNDTVDPGYDARPVSPGIDAMPDTVTLRRRAGRRGRRPAHHPGHGRARTAPTPSPSRPAPGCASWGPRSTTSSGGPTRRTCSSAAAATTRSSATTATTGSSPTATTAPGPTSWTAALATTASSASPATTPSLGGPGVDTITSTSLNRLAIKGGCGSDTVTVPVPGESGFKVVGNSGQDKLRMLAYPNPALLPTLRIDQRKGLTKVTKLAAGRA